MSALAKIRLNPAEREAALRVASAPVDMERVKRKLERQAEDVVDIVQGMIDSYKQMAKERDDIPRLTKDDIAIVEHTGSHAIRVFNLGAGAKQMAPLDDPKSEPRGFAGLKVFGSKKPKENTGGITASSSLSPASAEST